MIKLAGICAVFLAARIFYENYVEKDENYVKKYEDISLFINLFYVNFIELKMPFKISAELLLHKISPFADKIIENFLVNCNDKKGISEREALVRAIVKNDIGKNAKRAVTEFFTAAAVSDKETVKMRRDITIKQLEEQIEIQRKASEGKCKTAGALAFAVSAVTVIILI